MPFFSRDGIQFHFRQTGEGVPFFFQHGLGGDVSQPFGLFTPPPDFQLLAFDCRAHGQTSPLGDPQKISFNSFSDDLLALMDHLAIQQAVIGGISMGAGVALNFALRFPERTLGVLLQRPAWLAEGMRKNADIYGFIARLIREHGAQAGLEHFRRSDIYKAMLAASPDCANSLVSQFTQPRAEEAVIRLERMPPDAPTHDRAAWRKLGIQTLVLANRRDPIHPFEYGEVLAREIPGARFAELTPKSASVECHAAQVQQFITQFLSNLC